VVLPLSGSADCVRRLAELAGISAAENRTFDWAAVESDLGSRLPADYKLLAESFPDGWFRRFVRMQPPERVHDYDQSLSEFASGQLEALREFRATGEVSFPYPLFPEPGGVLPWGYIWSPGLAFWLTGPGDPDDWPVAVAAEEFEYWDRFDGTMCEFLTEVAAARYAASGFFEGPFRTVVDESEKRHITGRPIILAERPVFEPDEPAPPPPVPQVPRAPRADFWPALLEQLGGSRPVNDMAALRELIGAPPAGVARVDWAGVHARLGFRLPADYREFIDTYGPGTFGDIRIMAPGAPGEMDLFALLERKYSQVRGLVRDDRVDPPFFPEPGGTVSWGETVSGWTCGWAPTGTDPDEWTVTAIMPTLNLRGYDFQGGRSFSTMLKEHAEQNPVRHGLVPLRDPSAGPVTFRPYRLT
jgi:hypothetical protein